MKSDPLTGPLYIGTAQTDNLSEIVKMMKLFQERKEKNIEYVRKLMERFRKKSS